MIIILMSNNQLLINNDYLIIIMRVINIINKLSLYTIIIIISYDHY